MKDQPCEGCEPSQGLVNGILPDIGPTVLHLMGFNIPGEMTADCLVI